jgi:uncharacterized protein YndB with AHSA1/START domain
VPLQPAAGIRVPEGRSLTDRSIVFDLVVDGTPQQLFELWTTSEGVDLFFGHHSRIDGWAGGAYEIYFLPADHPDMAENSTMGAKLLWAEPGQGLGFEWTAPPFAAELNTTPLPTWVDVSFESLTDHKTVVHLVHHGFARGGAWDPLVEIFWRWWMDILHRLDRQLAC